MSLLTDRAGAMSFLLQEYPDLPQPSIVDICGHSIAPVGARLQLDAWEDVATWAARFDVPVTFTERTTHISAETTFTIFDVQMNAWSHLTHAEAHRLLAERDVDFSTGEATVPAAYLVAQHAAH